MAQGFLDWARNRAQCPYSGNTGQASDAAQREKTKPEGPVIVEALADGTSKKP